MWLTWRQLFARRRHLARRRRSRSRRCSFALVFRLVGDDGDAARVGFFIGLMREIVIGTLLPLAAVDLRHHGVRRRGRRRHARLSPRQADRALATRAVQVPRGRRVHVGGDAARDFSPVAYAARTRTFPRRVPLAFAAPAPLAGALIYSALFVMLGLTLRGRWSSAWCT